MSNIRKSDALDQGVGDSAGGSDGTTKASGSHRDVAPDVRMQGTTGSHLDQGASGGAQAQRKTGSNLTPSDWLVPGSDSTSDKQGGTPGGHDRISPTAGKSKSGSKNAQHPNVNAKDGGASGTYLGR